MEESVKVYQYLLCAKHCRSSRDGTALGSALESSALSGDICLWAPFPAVSPPLLPRSPVHPWTHRPVHAGHRAPGKEAGHAAGHVDLITQDVFPAVIAELEQLVRVRGHPWREEGREGLWMVGQRAGMSGAPATSVGAAGGWVITCHIALTQAAATPPLGDIQVFSVERRDSEAYGDGQPRPQELWKKNDCYCVSELTLDSGISCSVLRSCNTMRGVLGSPIFHIQAQPRTPMSPGAAPYMLCWITGPDLDLRRNGPGWSVGL